MEQNEVRESAPATDPAPLRWIKSRSAWWWVNVVGSVVIALIAANFAVDYALAQVPLPDEVKLPQSARVYDRDGNLIATYRDEVTRFMIDADTLPEHVRQAVVAAEDRDFYDHEGISLPGMARAAWENATSGRVTQGGSTISQQYIKNAVLEDPSRTITRKVNEAILAIKLERRYSKPEILEFYLNTVYFGRGAYGIEAAARTYFAKHAAGLTLAESAYLAGLIPSPQKYQAHDAAVARREYVLNAMEEEGYITSAEEQKANDTKLTMRTAVHLRPHKQKAAYFLEWLRKEYLYPHFGDCLFRCGLRIYTTIDMDMQESAEEAIKSQLYEETDPQAALVSMTEKGEVRALVGSRSEFDQVRKARGFNFAADSKRQAGSAFKPFTLLAAIEEGISTASNFSGESPKTIEDPACVGPAGQWVPENYGGSSYGTMDLKSATSNSVNTVYAELITEVGPENVADLVEALGFSGPLDNGEIDPVCSLALGTLDVSPLEMARAYATFAARGVRPTVTPIRWVDNGAGKCLLGFGTPKKTGCKKVVATEGERVADENSVDVLTEALAGVIDSGTATSAQIGRPAAGKTGTTQDNRDAWFAGYVPQMATVVWMGYPVEKGPDGKPGTVDDVSPLMHYCGLEHCRPVHGIDVVGGTFPASIWSAYMVAALEGIDIEYFTTPAYQPATVINPPPPPAPVEEDKDKDEDESDGDNGHGNDNGNGNGHGD
jgi:penicillin-binding protein 1A